jgi:hypothetical protein
LNVIDCNETSIIDVLISAPGINVNARDSTGRTPLHFAVQHVIVNDGPLDCVRALIAAPGIDVNITDVNGRSPLDMAMNASRTDVRDLLWSFGKINADGCVTVSHTHKHGHAARRCLAHHLREVQGLQGGALVFCATRAYMRCGGCEHMVQAKGDAPFFLNGDQGLLACNTKLLPPPQRDPADLQTPRRLDYSKLFHKTHCDFSNRNVASSLNLAKKIMGRICFNQVFYRL